jgi:hypothetical protein
MASEVYPRDAGMVLFISYILTPGSMQAEELNLRIALENLGNGRNNSLNTGRLAGSLIQWIGSPYVQRFRCTGSVEFQAVFWRSSAIFSSRDIR